MKDIIQWVILISSFLTAITTICMFCKKLLAKVLNRFMEELIKLMKTNAEIF